MKKPAQNDDARYKREKSNEAGYSITKTPEEALDSLDKLEKEMVEREPIENIIVDGKGTERTILPIWEDKREITSDWEENFGVMQRLIEADQKGEIFQAEATINVPSDFPELPIVLGFPSDPHLGSMDTELELYKTHILAACTTPNVFLAPGGDEIDLGMWKRLRFRQAGPPEFHSRTVRDLAMDLRGEKKDGKNQRERPIVLFRCTGNHGDTIFDMVGHEWAGIYFGLDKNIGERPPIFPSMGLAHVKVGSQEYDIALAHKRGGHSSLNIFLPCIRMSEYIYPTVDVAVVAHHHVLGAAEETRGGIDRVWLRPGTYRTKGWFERQKGYLRLPEAGMAAVMLYPDRKEAVGYKHFERALKDLHEKHLLYFYKANGIIK